MRKGRQTDIQTVITKLIVTFRNFVNATNNYRQKRERWLVRYSVWSLDSLTMLPQISSLSLQGEYYKTNIEKFFSHTSNQSINQANKQSILSASVCPYKQLLLYILLYTGCPGRNEPDFGRMFLKLKYTDITQNTYVQS